MNGNSETRNKMVKIIERRVVMMSKCTKLQWTNIPLKGQGRQVLTVGAISDPHFLFRALHWHHFTSHELAWSTKSTLEKQTSCH